MRDSSGLIDCSRVVPCPCFVEKARAFRQTGTYIQQKGAKLRQTFETFKVIKGTEDAYNAVKAFAEGTSTKPFLLLYGLVGCGKTHLCNAAAITLNYRGVDCRLFSVTDLLKRLRQSMNDNTIEQLVDEVESYQVLILDDFGAEYQTDWASARLFEIIDSRYRAELPLLLTTNYDLKDLPQRVVSRFCDPALGDPVLISAPDYRRRKRNQNK